MNCILCDSPALSGLKYCQPHYERAQRQTLQEKLDEQRTAQGVRIINRAWNHLWLDSEDTRPLGLENIVLHNALIALKSGVN